MNEVWCQWSREERTKINEWIAGYCQYRWAGLWEELSALFCFEYETRELVRAQSRGRRFTKELSCSRFEYCFLKSDTNSECMW